ncbi:MAG: hypothetical protein IT198_06440 [Acidimicrobiia bacterium]|nr:hypothetical protein [Acidimicrobiia bacterium]
MEFEVEAPIAHPREIAFRTLRDDLLEVVESMPNVDAVEILERKDPSTGRVEFVNIWHASAAVPKIARPFFPGDGLSWHDYATWDEADWSCEWRMEPSFLPERVDIAGRNTYEETADGTTVLAIKGRLDLDLHNFPGVPNMISRRAAPTVEKFVVNLIKPNLEGTAHALDTYLSQGE